MAYEPGASIFLEFEEEHPIYALDLSSLIFDFNRLYVAAVRYLVKGPSEGGVSGPNAGYGRNSYRLPKHQALQVRRIRFESPGFVEFLTPILALGVSATAITLTVLAIIEKSGTWPLQRENLRLDNEKKRLEIAQMRKAIEDPAVYILHSTDGQSAVWQLAQNPLKPTQITLRVDADDRI